MSRPPVPAGTVAMIAAGIMDHQIKRGELDSTDFSDYKIPGTSMTYSERTYFTVAQEAWKLVKAVEDARPLDD